MLAEKTHMDQNCDHQEKVSLPFKSCEADAFVTVVTSTANTQTWCVSECVSAGMGLC